MIHLSSVQLVAPWRGLDADVSQIRSAPSLYAVGERGCTSLELVTELGCVRVNHRWLIPLTRVVHMEESRTEHQAKGKGKR